MKIRSLIVLLGAVCLLPLIYWLGWLICLSLGWDFPYENNYAKASSPLHSILVRWQDKTAEANARDYILKELPRGSTEAAVLRFISDNLTSVRRKTPAYVFEEPYICVRTYECGSLAGSGGTEIVFSLDRARKLVDVHVYSESTFL